ncbi:tape measure protein [Mycobacterium phage Serendipitous]|uniref:Tape measure protein n=1 Tax=Mycobacterium phage Serendipitous TaxID=2301619 RepID=A0A385UGB8_9CAUD|nr:tail length tape measure protein [Mycobacterium phage Serendipitous]AYB70568.1 tape measure protein [Mycobacterium phage Serendipitous]
MTSAGNIKLGVEIDASDLSARLGEAVRRAIAPALAEIQRELNKVQREYDQTSRAADKSSAAQAAGAKTVAEAVEKVGEQQTKTAAKTKAAGEVTTRQINAITRALTKQTAAWEANTAARLGNAAAPVGGGPPRGGGGGGPPRSPGSRGFGDLFAGQGGGGRFITSPVGLNLGALGIGSLPAAATAVMQVVGAVQQLGQAGLALPGIYGAAAASVGTAVIGFKGIGDAVKALNEAAKSGDPKDLEKATEAMKDLDPAAVAVAKTVSGLVRGPLLDLQKATAGRMLKGFDSDLQNLADRALPRVGDGIGKIADSWNGTLKSLTGSLGSDRNLGLMDRILGNTANGQSRMNKALDPLVHAIATLTAGGTDVLPRLADGLAAGAERFDKWITKIDSDGRLNKWINDGITGLHQLAESGLNLVKIVTDITKASGADQGGFLKWLSDATTRLRTLTSSVSGQNAMREFFREGKEQGQQWLPILKNLAEILGEVFQASKTWSGILLPFLQVTTDLLTSMPGLLHAVLVGFLAWKTIGVFKPILSGLDGIAGGIDKVAAKAGKGGKLGGVRNAIGALGSTRGMTGLGLLAGGSITQITSDKNDVASQLMGAASTIGGGALTGAAIGSVIPGIGTAIGAGAGAAVGTAIAGINYLLADNKRAQEEAAAATEKLAAANERSHQAMELNSQAIKGVNDALAESGGKIDAATLAGVGDQISNITDRLAGAYDENTLKGIASAIGDVGMTTEQMAATITGNQGQFDALTARLNQMGPAGQIAAAQLASIRDNTLGMAGNAATAAPLLAQLSDMFGGIAQAGVGVQNAFDAVPHDVPVNISAPGGQAVFDILKQIGAQIDVNRDGEIHLSAPLSQQVLDQLKALGVQIVQNRDGTINVQISEQQYLDTLNKLGTLGDAYKQLFAGTPALPNVPVAPPNVNNQAANPFLLPGGADGMVIPGYAPGHDIVNAVLAPGEGVLIPEAVRGIGGPAGVYALNSKFRRGLSTRYYADGGVEPHLGTGALPGPVDDSSVLSVLIQIRDLLGGKGGAAANPLAATASNTATAAKAATNATGGKIGPFGTPLKQRGDPAYEMAAAAISALGGDPEKWIGTDPTLQAATASVLPGGVGMPGTMDYSRYAAALQAFARSGDLADVQSLGLNANDPVITALTSARNKKKGGLSDDEIAGLVGSTLGPTPYAGTLTEQNSSLIKSLQRYREQLMKQAGIDPNTGLVRGSASTAGSTGIPMTALPTGAVDPISAYAQRFSGGKYEWGASDLASGLSDCSGAVSDLVEIITKGQATSARLFSTADAGSVLSSLGAVSGAVPGALQIGWSAEHMRATLPNGVNFESGGGTGQGATYGGNAKGAAGLPNIMSLPINGVPLGAGYTASMGSGGLPGAATGGATPVYVTNWPGQGAGGLAGLLGGKALGAGIGAAGGVAGQVSGDVLGAIGSLGQEPWNKEGASYAALNTLVKEGNPLALAKALGLNVEDFTREGGNAGELTTNDGSGYDASGRLFSDTAGLIDRTFTSLNAQLQAMRDQMVDVIEQTNEKLQESALEPIVKSGVQSALESLKDSVSNAIGTAMGNAAAPPIADAVSSAVASLPVDSSGAGSTGGDLTSGFTGAAGNLFASGGPVYGGIAGKDSVPALLMPNEHVFTSAEVARMGGHAAVERFRSALMTGGVRHFATGGGVIGNDTVGAEFFGVSEVPIISTIVNLLVRVLLKVIGVEIEVRDTLNEMTDDFRGFRGDAFKAFDAQGRLLNDTSGLIERSSTSEETAAAERIRILKIVIQAIIKYLIEKVIVPIAKAVANSAIQAGASAAGAAVNTQAPGAGGIVSSLISSAGQAGVDIAAEVGTDFALAISETLIDVVAEGLQSQFPDLMTGIFSGGALASIFDPISGILGSILGIFTGLLGGGALGGAATMIPGDSLFPFDNGGMAKGMGYLPKATMDDELVLSPVETDLFSRFVSALERGGFGSGGNKTVHAPITVIGGRETAEQVENRLLKMLS